MPEQGSFCESGFPTWFRQFASDRRTNDRRRGAVASAFAVRRSITPGYLVNPFAQHSSSQSPSAAPNPSDELPFSKPFDLLARLPFEISSEIFMLCLPTVPSEGHILPAISQQYPLRYQHQRRAMSRWFCSLYPGHDKHSYPEPSAGSKQLLETWLARAGGHSLDISILGGFDCGVAASIHKRSDHLQCLELYVRSQTTLGILLDAGGHSFSSGDCIMRLWPLSAKRVYHEQGPGWNFIDSARRFNKQDVQGITEVDLRLAVPGMQVVIAYGV
ncbi:hypothetical protein DFH07DRAFT_942028 [Mycena maculata]|uniref:F-box domain-containing protein n=1 Tax=Mycena maculata TaxID=230809 RepID=A0AAD7N8J2_9AGAR|nr:hypothetical protein DFH07DRAFT_942028 [Mycena maculata]